MMASHPRELAPLATLHGPAKERAEAGSTIHPLREGVVAGVVVFCVAAVCLVTVWQQASKAIQIQVQRNLVALAQVAASTIDGDLHRSLQSPAQEQTEAYRQAVRSLRKLQARAPEIKFIYTVTLIDGQVYFVLDPTPPGDNDGDGVDDHSYLMQPYANADPEMLQVLRQGESLATKEVYSDSWGAFVSGYAPILDQAGQQVGAVGVDLSTDRYEHELAAVRWTALAGLGLALGVSGFISGLVYLARRRAQYTEDLHQHLFASVADGLWVLDQNGTIVQVNPKVGPMHGYEEAELIALPGVRLLHPDEHERFRQALAQIRQGHSVVWESLGVRKDGSVFPLEISGSSFWLRGELHLFAVVRDMSERFQQERALRESEKRLDLALEGAALGLWDWNIATGEHYVSERWATMLGYSLGEIPPVINCWDDLLHPDDREAARLAVQAHFDQGKQYDTEFRLRAQSGDWVWIQSCGMVVERDPNGRPLRMIGIHQDISRQKTAQAQLAQAKEAAEAASRAKSQFLANMSHEIRTPMTAILGYLELIVQSCPRSCESGRTELANYSTIVLQNAHLLLQIINDILDLSKIEAGKLEVDRVACSPRQILADVVELLKVRAEAKGLTLHLDYEGPIPETIQSDPVRLRQILINLVGNAIKFTDDGGVRLQTRLLGYPGDLPQLEIQVIDTGIGMSQEQTERLFRPFSQVDSSSTRRFGGTGLGLMLSRRLAELLGGDVTVQSTRGEGSTFTLTLAVGTLQEVTLRDGHEVVPPTPLSPPTLAVPPEVRLACRVLLVEDGPDNQRLLAFLLRKAGAEVVVASNGEAGVAEALASRREGRPFAVILMDMQMPVMDGYKATHRLRKEGWTGPVIALTAHAMKEARQECLDAGCDQYLTKPIDRVLLLRTVAVEAAKHLPEPLVSTRPTQEP